MGSPKLRGFPWCPGTLSKSRWRPKGTHYLIADFNGISSEKGNNTVKQTVWEWKKNCVPQLMGFALSIFLLSMPLFMVLFWFFLWFRSYLPRDQGKPGKTWMSQDKMCFDPWVKILNSKVDCIRSSRSNLITYLDPYKSNYDPMKSNFVPMFDSTFPYKLERITMFPSIFGFIRLRLAGKIFSARRHCRSLCPIHEWMLPVTREW